jgi:hypothetical protein
MNSVDDVMSWEGLKSSNFNLCIYSGAATVLEDSIRPSYCLGYWPPLFRWLRYIYWSISYLGQSAATGYCCSQFYKKLAKHHVVTGSAYCIFVSFPSNSAQYYKLLILYGNWTWLSSVLFRPSSGDQEWTLYYCKLLIFYGFELD